MISLTRESAKQSAIHIVTFFLWFQPFIQENFATAQVPNRPKSNERLKDDYENEGGGSINLCHLLYFKDVRIKLGVSDETFEQIRKTLDAFQHVLPTIDGFVGTSNLQRSAMIDKIFSEAVRLDDSVWAILSEILPPAGMDQLMGAHINYFGEKSILNKYIAMQLSISAEQRVQIRNEIAVVKAQRRLMLTQIANGSFKREQAGLLLLRESAFSPSICKQLTDKQRDRLLEMRRLGEDLCPLTDRYTFGW